MENLLASAFSSIGWIIGLAFLGSIIIAPIILLVLKPILNWLKTVKIFKSFIVALEEGFQGKADKVMEGVEDQAYSQKRILRNLDIKRNY